MAAKNAQLEDQLDTILNLMTQLQELRTSGDIHAIKNFTQRRRERERDSVMPNMATSIYLAYQQVQQDTFGLEYLMAICKPFGINGEDFDKPFAIETKLRKVVIQDLGTRVPTDKAKRSVIRSLREMYNPEIIDSITTRYFSTTRRHFQNQIDVLVDGLMKKKYTPLEVKEMFDHYMPGNPTSLFDSPKKKVISDALRKVLEKVAKPIPLESSYEAYLQAQEKYKERLQGHILKDFDPFSLFESLRGTLQMINYINRRFHDLGQAITLERVDFKTVLDRAYDIACPEDSDKPFYVDTRAMQLNPTFNTSSEVFATIIADRMFDVVRAGSPTFTIITREPNQNDILPFGDGIMDLESDALYLILENYGNPYQADVAEWNNEYLAGRRDTPMSTKGKGGGKGTERLKKFLDLYGAKCFIEPFQEETQQGTRYKILFPSLDFMR
ncbi:hypothetical protein COV17_01525 [Candidatus Woesearchaeota archaeon CG10_big_fil_rev_8_21_14_0_10_36_11]|nr:MAG: hypothetical protein COV17_01525 [Candidatus Woesearchaeota archaeon CG10_big_fil_rev_8_21_14_0_10_36_11]